MKRLILLAYLVVEIAAFAGLVVWLGVGWAVLITAAAAVLGLVVIARRGRAVFADLQRAARNEVAPTKPLTDTALLAGSSILLIVPGVVTTIIGLVLTVAPVRRLLAPAVAAMGVRTVDKLVGKSRLVARRYDTGTVVDGTVYVDTVVTTPGSSGPQPGPAPHQLPRGH